MLLGLVFALVVLFGLLYEGQCYLVPTPQIEVFENRGLRIIVEDVLNDISQVNFRVDISQRITNVHLKTYQKKVHRRREGKWIFTRRNVRLQVGDVISYQLLIIRNNVGYQVVGGPYTVKELVEFYWINDNYSETVPTTTTTKPQPQTPDFRNIMLETCKDLAINATYTITHLQSQISKLQEENEQLLKSLNTYTDSKRLTLSGRIPPDDDALITAKFILWEKLDLKPKIKSAHRNPDNSIVFEVDTLDEKLKILELANTRLRNTRIYLN